MRCLNCHYEEIPPNTEHCPRCKIHLPSLLRDVLAPGTLLRSETYRLDYALGRGSFGITYAARHSNLNEVFAIKEFYPIEFALRNQSNQAVIVPAQATHSYQRALHRFIEEARILAKLNHPNVVRVYDMFEGNDTAYMVMDLIEGKTLTQILKAQPGRKLPVPKVESLVEQIVEALSAIHQAGIYHLDIKPENLIVTPDNKIRLIDFGAARQVVHARQMDTRLFTEQYAAPEIMTGGELGPESDLFELGMMVYQLLTGKLPPPAMKRLTEEANWQPEGLIPPWERLVMNALQLKRDDRPATVREWWLGRAKFSGQYNQNQENSEGAVGLRGKFIQPDLYQDKMQQRLGRGVLRRVIALSPTLVVAIAASGGALFDLSTGELLWEIDTPVSCGTVTPDHLLLVLTHRRWVYVWDMTKGKLLQQFRGHEHPITSLAVSGTCYGAFASNKSSIVKTWDLRTGQEYSPFHQTNHLITQVAISRKGDYLAIGTQEGEVCFWDIEKHREVSCLQGHSQSITSLVFSPNQEILATGSRDNTIQLWSIPSGQHLERLKGHLDWVTSLVFSPDNRLLASAAGIDDKSIRLWDVAQSKEIKRLQGHWNRIQGLDFTPNSRYLISGSYDYTVRSWNLEYGVEGHQLKRHSNWVYDVACSPDGQLIATATNDQTIHLWNRLEKRQINTLLGHRDVVSGVTFSPDGQYLLSGSWDKTLRLWDANFGTIIRAFSGHNDWITCVAMSSNNRHIASGGWENLVRIWAVTERWQMLRGNKPTKLLQGHLDHITCIAFSPDNRLIATGSKDQTLRLWEVDSGQEIYQCTGHAHHVRCVAFSPDGQFVASGSWDKTVRIWYVNTGKEMKPAFSHRNYVNTIAYSGDSHWLAVGCRDGIIHLWDLWTGQEVKRLQGHTNSINRLIFHEQLLIAGDQDGVVRCWQL